jgi:hypothetical protein
LNVVFADAKRQTKLSQAAAAACLLNRGDIDDLAVGGVFHRMLSTPKLDFLFEQIH